MTKVKHKRTAAILMVSIGCGMAGGGFLMALAGAFGNGDGYYNQSYKNLETVGLITTVTGAALALGSIPVFVRFHRLREEATLSFNTHNISLPLQENRVAETLQMQLNFKVSISR
jgi:hypothetical protein